MAAPVVAALGISALVSALGWLAKEAWTWAKESAHAALRAAGALAVWVATHAATRLLLYSAVVLAVESFSTYLLSQVITPLAGNIFSRLLPSTSAGEFFHYVFWDSGLHAKRIVEVVLLYLSNYTLLWYAFDTWLRGMTIALGVYKAGIRKQDAVLHASLMK